MIKPWLYICLVLSLATLASCTRAPKPPTPPPTAARMECSLVPCRLPGRQALVVNDDWRRAVDELEYELGQCSTQVIACIERQAAQRPQ
ncbi:Rz1-like lysis system protein LysC [Ectopseudomonas khazarica]|uniref:Rz1-like lysis system protein LysC n=1 Tax=Ectopseudomonas khazarica TaxID=2502979 RepID=UPI00142F256F|nr:Rz1-like lysis system protein LysC [Pseudomonas khazarica]